jgi:hypothetical protein
MVRNTFEALTPIQEATFMTIFPSGGLSLYEGFPRRKITGIK